MKLTSLTKRRQKIEKELRSKLLHIVYHGTSKEKAESILKEGFKPWTYFAKDLSEALMYGGGYVFEVVMEHKGAPEWFEHFRCWQIMNRKHIPITKIITLRKYSREEIFANEKVRKKVFKRSLEYYHKIGRYGEYE